MDDYNLDFIQINFIKNTLFALTKYKDNYMLLTGKVKEPKLDCRSDNELWWLDYKPITYSKTAKIDITFLTNVDNDDTLFTLITLHNKEEYETILKIVEVLL